MCLSFVSVYNLWIYLKMARGGRSPIAFALEKAGTAHGVHLVKSKSK